MHLSVTVLSRTDSSITNGSSSTEVHFSPFFVFMRPLYLITYWIKQSFIHCGFKSTFSVSLPAFPDVSGWIGVVTHHGQACACSSQCDGQSRVAGLTFDSQGCVRCPTQQAGNQNSPISACPGVCSPSAVPSLAMKLSQTRALPVVGGCGWWEGRTARYLPHAHVRQLLHKQEIKSLNR